VPTTGTARAAVNSLRLFLKLLQSFELNNKTFIFEIDNDDSACFISKKALETA